MNPLTFISSTPLAKPGNNQCKTLAFDGKYFYTSSVAACKIFVYNRNLKLIECVKTNKGYDSLCYDNINKCFWASCDKFYSRVFKLNMDLIEIDSLPLPLCSSVVCDISYNCSENTLLVVYSDRILEVSVVSSCDYVVRQKKANVFYLSGLSISPFYMSAYLRNCLQSIGLYKDNNAEISVINTPNEYTVDSMVFVPNGACEYLYILCTRNGCYPYILKYSLSLSDIYSCNYNLFCNSSINESSVIDDSCNTLDESDDISKMISSLLFMQEELSNILKMQSTKIMNILKNSTNMDDVLLVNQSVNDTILNILSAENIIHSNLKLLLN